MTAPQLIQNNLNENLISRLDEKWIHLNFTKELEITMREVKYFYSYGFKDLPEPLIKLFEFANDLWV